MTTAIRVPIAWSPGPTEALPWAIPTPLRLVQRADHRIGPQIGAVGQRLVTLKLTGSGGWPVRPPLVQGEKLRRRPLGRSAAG